MRRHFLLLILLALIVAALAMFRPSHSRPPMPAISRPPPDATEEVSIDIPESGEVRAETAASEPATTPDQKPVEAPRRFQRLFVVDSDGKRAAGASVLVLKARHREDGFVTSTMETNDEGWLHFEPENGHWYYMYVRKEGGGQGFYNVGFVLAQNPLASEYTVKLFEDVSLRVEVSDRTGRPLQGVDVSIVVGTLVSSGYDMQGNLVKETVIKAPFRRGVTDASGACVITELFKPANPRYVITATLGDRKVEKTLHGLSKDVVRLILD